MRNTNRGRRLPGEVLTADEVVGKNSLGSSTATASRSRATRATDETKACKRIYI